MALEQICAYLNFDGQCAEAFKFYEKALGGTIEAMMPVKGSPAEAHMPPGSADHVLHACLKVGGFRIMASDAPSSMMKKPQGFTVSLHYDDAEEGRRVFETLAEGGTTEMPYQPTFWAKGYGMCTDRFGTPWAVNCSLPG